MKWFRDIHNRQIRLTDERQEHIEADHPEMSGQLDKIQETLSKPDIIVRSRTDPDVELFYLHYDITPVTEKYLLVNSLFFCKKNLNIKNQIEKLHIKFKNE